MHGPASTYGGSFKSPTWPRLPRIDVLDTVVTTLSPRRQRLWRRYRDEALNQWAQSGLRFVVQEVDPQAVRQPDWGNPDEIVRLESLVVAPLLRLMTMPRLYGGSIPAIGDWRAGGGVAAFKLGRNFWWSPPSRKQYLLAHEIGHALGLNHNMDSPGSVMSQPGGKWVRPDEHDLASLRQFYSIKEPA